jgi:hypothetical protein
MNGHDSVYALTTGLMADRGLRKLNNTDIDRRLLGVTVITYTGRE